MVITTKQQRRARYGAPRFISVDEAAAKRDCGRWKIYQDIKSGKLRSFLDGGSRRIYAEDAEKPPQESQSVAPKSA
jgi:excisionase family DNA binding protein